MARDFNGRLALGILLDEELPKFPPKGALPQDPPGTLPKARVAL
jgi:hypothetical protein